MEESMLLKHLNGKSQSSVRREVHYMDIRKGQRPKLLSKEFQDKDL